MNYILYAAVIFLASYLIGSIPWGLLIGKLYGKDVRKEGSGNIGATNVTRVVGPVQGKICFFLDFMKGFLPVLAVIILEARGFIPNHSSFRIIAMVAPVVGHMFPIFLKFKGGKGISTFGGIIVFYDWRIALGGFIVFVLVAIISKYISMASSIGTFSTIIFCLIINRSDYYLLIFLTIVFVTITIKHIPNYKRLCKKEESRITILDHKHHKTN